MRRDRTNDRTDDESRRWFGRSSGRSENRNDDASGGVLERARRGSTEPTTDDSRGVVDRIRGQSEEPTRDESQGWFGRARAEYGLGALLVAAGVALFLFPEPATSAAGIGLIVVGALVWLVSLVR